MYKKFMEEVMDEKKPTAEEQVAWKEKYSANSLGQKIPNKQKDPRMATVPCTVKEKTFKKVLIDPGASVSLMPLSIYHRLDIKNVSDTETNLKFTDHSRKDAYGIAEDVLTSRCNLDLDQGTLTLKAHDKEITLNAIEDQELEEDIEYHYQVGLIRTEARRQSNMPTSEKDAERPSRLSSLPLATLNGNTPISIPKTKRKKKK
ncbi:hypothetical protein KIW84_042199 [Lathyrus oleraceus]|uniref:Uncharacterized protein n=1 Tax=Pisum sativum TaxID=3888 RepID=A0A9D4XDR4_PEA|nr:hypothetical protein KIW84_042199 [Pisum sativum]